MTATNHVLTGALSSLTKAVNTFLDLPSASSFTVALPPSSLGTTSLNL